MAERLGPMDFQCDALPYPIVRACRMVGIRSAEDVGWYRYSRFVNGYYDRRQLFTLQTWKSLLGMGTSRTTCRCGQALPRLEHYTFTFLTGRKAQYLLGQCGRCRTIYWEEA